MEAQTFEAQKYVASPTVALYAVSTLTKIAASGPAALVSHQRFYFHAAKTDSFAMPSVVLYTPVPTRTVASYYGISSNN